MEGARVGRGGTCMSATVSARRSQINQLYRRQAPVTKTIIPSSPARVVRAAAAVATDSSDLGTLFRDALEQRPQGNDAAASIKTPPVQETGPAAEALLPSDVQTPPVAPEPQPPDVKTPPVQEAAPAPPPPVQEAAPAPQPPDVVQTPPVQEAAPPPAPQPTPELPPPVSDAPGEVAGVAPESSFQLPDFAAPRDTLPGEAPSSGTSPFSDSAADRLGSAANSAAQTASRAADAVTDNAVQTTTTSAQDSTTSALSEAARSSADAVSNATSGLVDGVSEGVSAAREAAQQLLDSANTATEDLQTAASGLQESVNTSLSSALDTVQASGASAVGALPEPVQQALFAVSDAAQFAAQQAAGAAAAAPVPAAVIAAGAVAAPLVLRSRRFQGFGGLTEPAEAYAILQSEDAVLIDVRSDDVRQLSGVPALDRGALGKGVAVPFRPLPSAVARSIRKADQVAAQVTATTIANLKAVSPGSTRIIVMDRGDGQAVAVAKALEAVGCRRSSVLSGGFGRWVSAGLPIEERDTEYSVSPLKRLGTSTGLIAEQAAGRLRNPATYAAVPAVALAAAAAADWHTTLRFVGVSATLFTVAARVTSYSSPQDAREDLQSAYDRVRGAVSAPLKFLTGAVQKVQRAAGAVSRTASRPAEEAAPAPSQQDAEAVSQQ